MSKWTLTAVVAGAFLFLAGLGIAQESRPQSKPADVDWNYARKLLDKERTNPKDMTADEKAYLDNAKRVRAQSMREGRPGDGAGSRPAGGGKLPGPASQGVESTGMIPLDQMTADQKYKGEDGGLYGGGKNDPPEAQQKAATAALAKIQPLDEKGKPSPDGKIVLMSMGMSNTTQEFSAFKAAADKDPLKSSKVVIVDCAQGGKDAFRWTKEGDAAGGREGAKGGGTWDAALAKLKAAGVTPEQVQVMWVKHARIGPEQYGEFPEHAKELKTHWVESLNIAAKTFPNLRVAYLSSRIYAGYAGTRLNPEPYSYEGAFTVRWMIQEQMKGSADLNWDASKGEVKSPVLLWGPYLWADGTKGRKSDGLIWERKDLAGDGTHPSPESGREKVAKLLLDFMKTNPNAKGWFCKAKE